MVTGELISFRDIVQAAAAAVVIARPVVLLIGSEPRYQVFDATVGIANLALPGTISSGRAVHDAALHLAGRANPDPGHGLVGPLDSDLSALGVRSRDIHDLADVVDGCPAIVRRSHQRLSDRINESQP